MQETRIFDVSVVIPTYNGVRYIAAALDSVRAQTYDPSRVEVVVVDDGSTDGTAELVESRGDVRCIRQANAGVAAARNHGVAETTADVVMLLDQDDLWEPDKVALQMEYLRAHPDAGVVAGHMQAFLEPGVEVFSEQVRRMREQPMPYIFPSIMAFRREIFARSGPFETSFAMSSDFDWLVRLRLSGVLVHMLPDLLCRYRVHGSNSSHDLLNLQREMLHVIHRRRRLGAS